MKTEETKESLLEYRVTVLEKAVQDLSEIKDIVLRWDAKFSGDEYLKCPIHKLNLDDTRKRLDKVENTIDWLKSRYWYGVGGLAVLTIMLQCFIAPIIIDKYNTPSMDQHSNTNVVAKVLKSTTLP